jgi:hypothetical protein
MTILSWSDMDDNGHLFVAGVDQFLELRQAMAKRLLKTEPENHGKWQQLDISESDAHATHELLNVTIWYQMPESKKSASWNIGPDLPWAENHFRERVGGKAINPGVEHANWPYHAGQVALHQNGGKYDHNYMERFWPTDISRPLNDQHPSLWGQGASFPGIPWNGYRFPTGDLADVCKQLRTDRGTRQAYLPVFFPEDTGATQGQRVPCTLGYHFIVREGRLHVQYNMRSCEIYRHFTNDVYMAVRLAHWVRDQVNPELDMGQLTMNIVSLHGFVGDVPKIEEFI